MKLRRFHLFEIEDLSICPSWLRDLMTSMIVVLHRWFGVANVVAAEVEAIASETQFDRVNVIDLCSGAGGPMPDVLRELNERAAEMPSSNTQANSAKYNLVLTDLYPNQSAIRKLEPTDRLRYFSTPVDACRVDHRAILGLEEPESERELTIRTMVCSFHHMPPQVAIAVLADAQESDQPLVIFELTDGKKPPNWLWWVALVPNFFFAFFVATFSRPMTLGRIVFTFLIPIVPVCFAWDGAVSAARAYGESDFQKLLGQIPEDAHYEWAYKSIPKTGTSFSVIVGKPIP